MTLKQHRILIVEDNPLNMKLVKSLLKIMGCLSVEAETAERGIELAREQRPDLILMDIELPGMDGITATRILKNDPGLKDINVIALSAYAMDNEKAEAMGSGFDGYLTKPIDVHAFIKIIGDYLNPSQEEAPKIEKCPSNHRILIVDDEPLNVKLLNAKLSAKGYQILCAYDGKTAIEKVHRDHPNLILLDIMMPGMDGYEVTKQLKSDPLTQHIPIILITALDGEDDKEKGLSAGADEFLNKPINYTELEARVLSLLKLKEYKDALDVRKESQKLIVEQDPVEGKSADRNSLPFVLIAEDDEGAAKLMTQYLSHLPCRVKWVESGRETLETVFNQKVDVILLDVMLPELSGFEVCRQLKENEDTFPIQIVMITSLIDLNYKIRGIGVGADDYLVKPIHKEELCTRIGALFKKKNYLDHLREKIDAAVQAAIIDGLTGVYNRDYFNHFLKLEMKRSQRYRHPLSLLMIDVDNFKSFNDTHGHVAGDMALRQIGELLKKGLREIDLAARYGGEEFAAVLPYADQNTALMVAERLLSSIRKNNAATPTLCPCVSIGLAVSPMHANSAQALIIAADSALYSAKRNGRNRIRMYEDNERDQSEDCIRAGI